MTEVTTNTTDAIDRNDWPAAVGGIGNYASETKCYPNNVHVLCFLLFSICNYSFVLRYSHLFSKKIQTPPTARQRRLITDPTDRHGPIITVGGVGGDFSHTEVSPSAGRVYSIDQVMPNKKKQK